jgi:hypothetical protein
MKQEQLEYVANVLAEYCHHNQLCIYDKNRFNSYCPFEDSTIGCSEITPVDWLKYMQGLEVSEL